jgi:hypothetical protein
LMHSLLLKRGFSAVGYSKIGTILVCGKREVGLVYWSAQTTFLVIFLPCSRSERCR